MASIDIKNLDVVFGDYQSSTLEMIDQGLSRQEILDKTGDVVGVKNANLHVAEGEICVLMGLSGSGKSSLLRAINGLNAVSRGSLEIHHNGETIDLATCNEPALRDLRRSSVSMVFQKFALMPWLSVVDNVAFGLEMKGISKRERRKQALEKLEMVGLAEWADNLPHELSGGMQQRVGLARAFAMDSDILLMDEPFSALDPLIRSQLQDELMELQRKLQKTIVFVSHDLDEALKIGTHIAIMESAEIVQHGTPEDIVMHPSNGYVEDFVAHTNPLNVLHCSTLMTRVEDLPGDGQDVKSFDDRLEITLDNNGSIATASYEDQPMTLSRWNEGKPLASVPRNSLVVADPTVNMRRAIELRYRSDRPIVLEEDGKLVGVLADRDFYYALLGKYFTQEECDQISAA